MSRRWLLLVISLLLALPSALHAVGMGGMGGMGMGAMVAKVNIDTKTVGTVVFEHGVHGSMFRCNACHPKIFQKKANSNHVTMQAMEKGKACGACHKAHKKD